MLRKKEAFTVVTPIPGFIPRQLAIDILHSHSEVITLNPLVLGHKAISAPRDAAADEFYSTWYEIEERIQVLPGMGKIGSGKISFKGCFHDMPWGLQTHIYAPLSIDVRTTYRICGNQPGVEPPAHREIGLEGLGAPVDGLYMREDIEIKCNITMVSFVKSQQKAASKEMIQRIIKKAELLDAGVLKAMMMDGKLTTVNPMDRSTTPGDTKRQSIMNMNQQPYSVPAPLSPMMANASPQYPIYSPTHPQFANPSSPPPQFYSSRNSYQQNQQNQQNQQSYPAPPIPPKEQMVIMELPGDYPTTSSSYGLRAPPHPGNYNRDSSASSDPRWSQSQTSDHQRSSMSSMGSPGQHPGFATELSSHNEISEIRGERQVHAGN